MTITVWFPRFRGLGTRVCSCMPEARAYQSWLKQLGVAAVIEVTK